MTNPTDVEQAMARHEACCAGKDEHIGHVFESCDHWEPRWCAACSEKWPCDTAIVAKDNDRLTRELADSRTELLVRYEQDGEGARDHEQT